MAESERQSILHELYVFSEWKPEPEYLQKPDSILPDNISALWRWLKFFGPKKNLIDSVTAFNEGQQRWQIALGDEGKVIAVLTDNILEIRTKRSEYATIAARTTVSRDGYPQWRKVVWSPDCSFLALAYGNGTVSFFDLTASNLFNIPADCSRPGGLECTDNTHAVADIIFMPLRVKDTKWNWEVLVVTYDGKLRGYLVSQTDGFKLHHTFRFPGGVAAITYCGPHASLYVAGVPRAPFKDVSWGECAGVCAWRVLNDEPFYMPVEPSAQTNARRSLQLYLPYVFRTSLNFIVRMVASPDSSKLVCVHCNGDVSVWRLPTLRPTQLHRLAEQPAHDARSPLQPQKNGKDAAAYLPADVNWWSNEEIIVSRFNGAVTVCNINDMVNILGKKPEFFQGTPQLTCAHKGAFMVLECESSVLPGRKAQNSDSMEVVKAEVEADDSIVEVTKELVKSVLYAITDIETFQPKPKKITVVSRVYRLLGVKSTTPTELFSRKIESGAYAEALALAESFGLDSDLVYQQQWRRSPVCTDTIHNYLSKVSKKIWAVHQCVDRLAESLPAATELLHFGLQLADHNILEEINKDLPEEEWKTLDEITLEDLNAYTSELLRCRHVMLFYRERLRLYEAILRCEKSTYVKDEYDRLRSNSIVHSAVEIAKEGRIEALTCLWPHLRSLPMKLSVLDSLPETLNPLHYQHLLPTAQPLVWFEKKSPIKVKPSEHENDWCKKEIFRSIWSSNWSEDASPEGEGAAGVGGVGGAGGAGEAEEVSRWYVRRAREVESRSGLVSHALTLVSVGAAGGVGGLASVQFHLRTLDTLLYDTNVEGVTLAQLETMSHLDTCKLLMQMSTPETFVADLKQFVIPFLKRVENLTNREGVCLTGLTDFLESISVTDLSYILLVLQSPREFELDLQTHLELAERCLLAYSGTDHLYMACDLLDTILRETDGSISTMSLVRRVTELERLVAGSERAARRGLLVAPRQLRDLQAEPPRARLLLARLARSLAADCSGDHKPTPEDWEELLKDILEFQSTLFEDVTIEECYEIYALALLTSGDAASIRLAAGVLTCAPPAPRAPAVPPAPRARAPPPAPRARAPPPAQRDVPPAQRDAPPAQRDAPPATHVLPYARSTELVSNAAKEYFNSASSLTDPALELARCCLLLIESGNNDIEQELDLIAALPILGAFKLTILPIQVRLCEDKLSLVEECLRLDPSAYLASHKLLKLAQLLRIAGDDEQTREGVVLERVAECAMRAGAAGGAAAAAAARRLAALRHAPAAPLLARLAAHAPAHAHADRAARAHLLAAALAHAPPHMLRDMLRDRLKLELEDIQQTGAAFKEHAQITSRWPSTDDEFADAITTPVIEKKDLVEPTQRDRKVPLLNYLLDSFQNKFTTGGAKVEEAAEEQSVCCPEFYRSVYPDVRAAPAHYAYERFALAAPAPPAHSAPPAQALLQACYVHDCLTEGQAAHAELEVVQRAAEEAVHRDTALGVACLLRCARDGAGGARAASEAALSATLYAALINCNAPDLRDNVYLAKPCDMARTTLRQNNASEEQMALIGSCLRRLGGAAALRRVRGAGLAVSAPLFAADEDYRAETIYRLARTCKKENVELSCSLARKYGLDPLEAWLQYARALRDLRHLDAHTLPHERGPDHFARVQAALWAGVGGSEHAALLALFAVLRQVDERQQLFGLTAADHIKLLKKAKAASPELDYKLLSERPSTEALSAHLVSIMTPESVGLLSKFLRTLPPPYKLPVSVNTLYTDWLIQYFFSTQAAGAGGAGGSKKWMQQYRQCASFFHKLPQAELLRFLSAVCFSPQALARVPPGTRNLMLMQAVDYCHQEQENDFKFNKNEQTWAQVGQELSRWARFLENFHSSAVQAIVDHSDIPRDTAWPELEMSHGSMEGDGAGAEGGAGAGGGAGAEGAGGGAGALAAAGELVLRGLRAGALASLGHCLHLPLDAPHVFQHLLRTRAHHRDDVQTLVTRLTQYHKEGVKFSEELLEEAMEKATQFELPPHKQLALLALSQKTRVEDGDDLLKIAQSTLDLFKAEWPDNEYVMGLTSEALCGAAGRGEAFVRLQAAADSPARRLALAHALRVWPRTLLSGSSLCSEFVRQLAARGARGERLLLVKLLLQRPVLLDQEVRSLVDASDQFDIMILIWVVLLSKCEHSDDMLYEIIMRHQDNITHQDIDDDLIKEILDQGMFIKLVSTPIYSHILNYIMNAEASSGELITTYTVRWATDELVKANYISEAGHLQLLAIGIPNPLRGFSQSVQYCKNIFK